MAFIKVADTGSSIELVLFPKMYEKQSVAWQRDQVVIVRGKAGSGRGGRGDGELKILVDEISLVTAEDVESYKPTGELFHSNVLSADRPLGPTKQFIRQSNETGQRLYIRLEDSRNHPMLMALKEKLDGYSGKTEVVLVTGPQASRQVIKLPQTISVNEESLRDLASVFGATNVVVK